MTVRTLAGHTIQWCIPCNARDRVHVNGACSVCGNRPKPVVLPDGAKAS